MLKTSHLMEKVTMYLCKVCFEAYSETVLTLDTEEMNEHMVEKHPELLHPVDEDEPEVITRSTKVSLGFR